MVDGTFNMSAGAGFALSFTSGTYGDTTPISFCSFAAKAEVYVQPVYNGGTLTAPVASPAVAGGNGTPFIRLQAGDTGEKDLARGFSAGHETRSIIGIRGWAVAAGDFVFEGV